MRIPYLKQSASFLPIYARQGLKAPFTSLANAQSQRDSDPEKTNS
jgi:hypothetical protein